VPDWWVVHPGRWKLIFSIPSRKRGKRKRGKEENQVSWKKKRPAILGSGDDLHSPKEREGGTRAIPPAVVSQEGKRKGGRETFLDNRAVNAKSSSFEEAIEAKENLYFTFRVLGGRDAILKSSEGTRAATRSGGGEKRRSFILGSGRRLGGLVLTHARRRREEKGRGKGKKEDAQYLDKKRAKDRISFLRSHGWMKNWILAKVGGEGGLSACW